METVAFGTFVLVGIYGFYLVLCAIRVLRDRKFERKLYEEYLKDISAFEKKAKEYFDEWKGLQKKIEEVESFAQCVIAESEKIKAESEKTFEAGGLQAIQEVFSLAPNYIERHYASEQNKVRLYKFVLSFKDELVAKYSKSNEKIIARGIKQFEETQNKSKKK